MSVLTIRQAKREGARLLLILSSVSGGGKTRTALEIAYGLSNYNPAKIGVIDSENRRGSLYAHIFESGRPNPSRVPFLIGDLYAPFSPDRYIAAMREFQAAGVEVLIIDSGSHEWEGIGGCQQIAEGNDPKRPNWNKGKAEHKKFMNVLLTCDMHVILCLRAREKSIPEKQLVDGVMKTVYVDHGLQAITEKNVMFEATASLMLDSQGARQQVIKCPGELLPMLGRGEGYITAADGKAVRDWVDGAKQLDPEVERFRNILISTADQGIEPLKAAWNDTPKPIRRELGEAFLETCKAAAAEYERQRIQAEDDGGASALEEALATGSAAPAGVQAAPEAVADPIAAATTHRPAADPAPAAAKPAARRAPKAAPAPEPRQEPAPTPVATDSKAAVDLF